MLWTRSELKGRAKFLLKQNYWYSVLAALIYTFLLGNGFTYSYNALKNKNSEVETSIQGFHPILMLGIAATGPGISKVGPVMNFHPFSALSKLVFCFDMLIGRLEIFPYLLLLSPELWRRRF